MPSRTLSACIFPVLILLSTLIKAQDSANFKTLGVREKKKANPVQGETYAIIVGVSNYPGIQPLKYADKDALLFRDFLQTPAGGNTKKENLFVLINDSAKAANFNVKAYGWLKRKALKPGDRLYIYFSGHGDAMNEDNYFFLPFDCAPSTDDNNYLGTGHINMHSVKTLFIKPLTQKGVEVFLIVDACRTNELPGGELGQKNFASYVQAIAEQKQGEIIMLSTGAGQVSVESPKIGNGHGLFTWYLIDGLSGLADKEGDAADNDGAVSLAEITSWVKNKVRKDAKQLFKTDQVPYFCCAEKDLHTVVTVDSVTYNSWVSAKNLRQITGDENLFDIARKKPVGTKGNSENKDTALIAVYNQFIQAQKSQKLIGPESAEIFYTRLVKNWPGNDITEEARYSLASEFINFGQQKINLFLNGKGITYVQLLEEQYRKKTDGTGIAGNDKTNIDSSRLPPGIAEQVTKMKTLAITGFDVAADMTEKAIRLLKNDPELLEPVFAKYYFLKAQAVNEKRNENAAETRDALSYARMAINRDTTASYNYYLMGSLLSSLDDDSSIHYYNRSISLAPRWAYPVNGLANYYSSNGNARLALQYYHEAVQLDSMYSNGWQNIGTIHYEKGEIELAKTFYQKALSMDPCNAYANLNLGVLYRDSIDKKDSFYTELATSYFKKAIQCDSSYGDAYFKLAGLYTTRYENTDNKKFIDTSLQYLELCIVKNPNYARSYATIGRIYLDYKGDTVRSKEWYVKAYNSDPLNFENLKLFASFYDKIGDKKGLDKVFRNAIAARPGMAELYNSIGNYYLDHAAGNNDDIATSYYYTAHSLDPGLSYVNYNLGRVYRLVDDDSTKKYYALAAALDSNRYNYLYENIGDIFASNLAYDSAVHYYKIALDLKTTNLDKCTEKLVNIYLSRNNNVEAEAVLKKYLPQTSFTYLRLMGYTRAKAGRHTDAEIFFSMAAGLNEEAARTFINSKSYPYYFQSRFPDKQGLLTSMYSDKLIQTGVLDSVIQLTVDKKLKADSRYIFPYSHSLVLTDKQVFKNLNGSNSLYTDIMKVSGADSNNTFKWLLRSLVDRYEFSHTKNKTDTINYAASEIWPASSRSITGISPVNIIRSEDRGYLLSLLMSAVGKDSTNPRLFTALGDMHLLLYRDNVEYMAANKLASRPIKFNFDSAIVSHFKSAIRNYSKAIARDKEFATVAYSKMGDFYGLSRNYDLAGKSYRKAIESDPGFIYPYIKLGDLYASRALLFIPDSALHYYKVAYKLDPGFQPLNIVIGKLYLDINDLGSSVNYFQQAVRDDPNPLLAKAYLSRVFLETGKIDSARLYQDQVLKAFLKTPDLFYTELFYVAVDLAARFNYPEICDTFFKAGFLIPSYNKIDPKIRDPYDIEFYRHYASYYGKLKDTNAVLRNLETMFYMLNKVGDPEYTANSKKKIMIDPNFIFIRESKPFVTMMNKYPIIKPKITPGENIR